MKHYEHNFQDRSPIKGSKGDYEHNFQDRSPIKGSKGDIDLTNDASYFTKWQSNNLFDDMTKGLDLKGFKQMGIVHQGGVGKDPEKKLR